MWKELSRTCFIHEVRLQWRPVILWAGRHGFKVLIMNTKIKIHDLRPLNQARLNMQYKQHYEKGNWKRCREIVEQMNGISADKPQSQTPE